MKSPRCTQEPTTEPNSGPVSLRSPISIMISQDVKHESPHIHRVSSSAVAIMPADTPIPDIPGALLTNPAIRHHLNQHVGNLCGLHNGKYVVVVVLSNLADFPDHSPCRFRARRWTCSRRESGSGVYSADGSFWVCEKSDGVRVLLFVVMNGASGGQECWLVRRHIST